MTRALSFGYNAALAISERVIDRLVGVGHDDGRIPETFTAAFPPSGAGIPGGTAHILVPKPHLTLDTGRTGRNAVLTFEGLRCLIEFTAPLPPGYLAQEGFTATVRLTTTLEFDQASGRLGIDPTQITDADITLPPPGVVADPGVTPAHATLLGAALPSIAGPRLRALPPNSLSAHVAFDGGAIHSDSVDAAILNDTTAADRDALNLLLFDSFDSASRGTTAGAGVFLEPGKSFTLRISQAVFDKTVQEFIDRRFMRFAAPVDGVATSGGARNIAVSVDYDSWVVNGRADANHAGVHGAVTDGIYDRERGFSYNSTGFAADQNGVFTATFLRTHLPRDLLATEYDVASFSSHVYLHGDFFRDVSTDTPVDIYPPDIHLADGAIAISGRATVDDFVTFDVDYSGRIALSVNPLTGRIEGRARDVEVDIPWWADIGLWLLTGPFSGVIMSGYSERIAGEISEIFQQSNTNALPALGDRHRMAVFFEDIQVRSDGLILSGQIEAGRIQSAGRAEGGFHIDSEPLPDPRHPGEMYRVTQRFGFNLERREVTSFANAPWGLVPLEGSGIVDLGSREFEALALEDLMALTYARTVAFPADSAIQGNVYGVRTPWGRFAKVRVDRVQGPTAILRWVTYEAPVLPKVTILGDWMRSEEPTEGGGIRHVGASRYWGDFSAVTARLYAPFTRRQWSYAGPGEHSEVDDGPGYHVEIDTVADADSAGGRPWAFDATLGVEIVDRFGRSARAERRLTGSARHRTAGRFPTFPRIRNFFRPRQPDPSPERRPSRRPGDAQRGGGTRVR